MAIRDTANEQAAVIKVIVLNKTSGRESSLKGERRATGRPVPFFAGQRIVVHFILAH